METSGMFPRDDETAALGRKATQLKDVGDWDGAISCLRQMQERMWESPVHYGVEGWCRLAHVLQQAGKWGEAEKEFERLIEDLPRLARKHSFMDDPTKSFGKTSKQSVYNRTLKTYTSLIKEQWETAKKREKRRIERLQKQ